jgi:pimeloyl-ACP methyl ester carboxylesterase
MLEHGEFAMHELNLSHRMWMGGAMAMMAGLAPDSAGAAPFASDRMSVRVEGAGPDVILVPGLNSSPRVWASTVAALPGYRFHLVHIAGFGGQPAAGNRAGDVAAPVAEEIARYIGAAGLKQPAVIGHSLGGSIGMMLASRHPAALSRLMVVDIFPYMGVMFGGPGATPAEVAAVADRIAAGMRAASPAQRAAAARELIDGMVNNVGMRPVALADTLASDPDVGTRAFHELIVINLIPALKRIAVPVTVLYVQPKSVPLPAAQFDSGYKTAYASIGQLTLKRIPDSAHFIMWDQPARFRDEVAAFLDK